MINSIIENVKNMNRRLSMRLPKSKSKDGAIKLNLGCGDKLLKDYINIDVAFSRKGKRPDFISDIRKLSLPDGFADEILTVHVVEHFYYWEIVPIVQEWFRVLKPGGKMIVECPNLLSAAQKLFDRPESSMGEGKELQETMWVLYGDPTWKDPLMCHRWAYTPQSLTKLMTDAGLVQVKQEPAEYKKREPRDMRVVGIKPTVTPITEKT